MTKDLHAILTIPYADYGRDASGLDCWGLARLVRYQLRGEWLPSYGAISPADKRSLTDAAAEVAADFRIVADPKPGALVTVWRAGMCQHIGIVIEADGALVVLDTCRTAGVRWVRLREFYRQHPEVVIYDRD